MFFSNKRWNTGAMTIKLPEDHLHNVFQNLYKFYPCTIFPSKVILILVKLYHCVNGDLSRMKSESESELKKLKLRILTFWIHKYVHWLIPNTCLMLKLNDFFKLRWKLWLKTTRILSIELYNFGNKNHTLFYKFVNMLLTMVVLF